MMKFFLSNTLLFVHDHLATTTTSTQAVVGTLTQGCSSDDGINMTMRHRHEAAVATTSTRGCGGGDDSH